MTLERAITHGGRTLRQVRVADFTVAEAVYRPDLRVPLHSHEQAYLGFVLDGSCRETVGGREFDYTPRTLVVKTPGEQHSNQAGPVGTRYLVIEVARERKLPGVFEHHRDLRGSLLASLGLRLRDELHAGDAASELAMEGLLLELLAEVSRRVREPAQRPAPPWLARARDLIRDRYRQPLGLASLSRELGVHPTHLARAFRRHEGITPGAYLRRVRIERATRLLARSDLPLADVARAAGFCDQAHLSRVLRRHTGLTPAAYRRGAGGSP